MLFFIYSIIYILSFATSILLWLMLFKYRNKTKTDQAVLLTVGATSFWFLADFFTLEIFFNNDWAVFFWRFSILASFLLVVLLVRAVFIIVDTKFSKGVTYFCYFLCLFVAYFIIFTDYLVKGVFELRFTGQSNFIAGDGFVYWGILIALMIFYALFLVVKKIKSFSQQDEKLPLVIFGAGIFLVFLLVSTSNILLPILGFDFPRLAVLAVLSLLIITVYIIYKWNVFGFYISSFNIRYKITAAMMLAALIPILVISAYFYNNTNRVLEDEYLGEELIDLKIKRESIDYLLDFSKEDVLFLSNLANLKNYINFSEGEDKDFSKANLTVNFLNFSKSRGIYYQIRYLDETGQEIIRVDKLDGDPFVVPEDKLQNKAGRYYFEEAMKIKEDEIYISPLDLNIENGQIEVPYKPVVRYSTPVFDNRGQAKGVVITNIDANILLDIIKNETDSFKEYYLINKDGYFLVHPDSEMEWGFMFDKEENNINKLFPEIANHIQKNQGNQFYCYVEDCYVTFQYIYPSGLYYGNLYNSDQTGNVYSADNYWILFSKIDKYKLNNVAKGGLFYVYLIILLILALTIIISFVLSNFIAKPVKKLRDNIAIVTKGDLSRKVYIKTKDELKDLSDDFNLMVEAIKKSRKEVDRKVTLQTKEIMKNNQNLEKQQRAVLNILEDVEEEKTKTESLAKDLEKFKLAVDNASDHIVITDENGTCLYANKAVEKITGFKKKEVLGKKVGSKKNWGGLMGEEFYDNFWRALKKDKTVFEGYVTNKRKNGEHYDALASISPILDNHGHVKFFVGIERDMTEEKNIDRAKSEFVSLASHQLRTPLSTINWYAEMLLSEDAGRLSEEQREFTSEIYKGNQRMVDLVNSLLNVSRIELGTLAVDPKPTNLIDQAESVLNEIKPLLAKKKLKIIKNFGKNIPEINLDDKLMRIVWQNLLSNALKYTPVKGQISITVSKDKTNAKIAVGDTGFGIPKEQQDKIFTKLFRADNVKEKETDGTGLGLYIVKSVVEQFGGKIWFESEEGKGTTFFINIPLKGVKPK